MPTADCRPCACVEHAPVVVCVVRSWLIPVACVQPACVEHCMSYQCASYHALFPGRACGGPVWSPPSASVSRGSVPVLCVHWEVCVNCASVGAASAIAMLMQRRLGRSLPQRPGHFKVTGRGGLGMMGLRLVIRVLMSAKVKSKMSLKITWSSVCPERHQFVE